MSDIGANVGATSLQIGPDIGTNVTDIGANVGATSLHIGPDIGADMGPTPDSTPEFHLEGWPMPANIC